MIGTLIVYRVLLWVIGVYAICFVLYGGLYYVINFFWRIAYARITRYKWNAVASVKI